MVYGHVMRREEEHAVRRVMTKVTPGKKEERETEDKIEGRVQTRCMQTVGLRAGEEGDRAYWRARIYNRRPRMTAAARDEESHLFRYQFPLYLVQLTFPYC